MINLQHIASHASVGDAAAFEGHWHTIEYQPDLSVPQCFTIGVALATRGKLSHYRIASEAPRLKCFYENRFDTTVWEWLSAELLAELERARNTSAKKFVSASPQLRLGAPHYICASDPDSALNRTFDRVVTVVQGPKPPRSRGITQAELREAVANRLKLTWRNRFEQIAQPSTGMVIKDNDVHHRFDVTYDDTITASSVISGCNVGVQTSQLNTYKAWSDLQALSRIRKRAQIGLAVLFPTEESVGRDAMADWHNFWWDFSYKLKQSDKVLVAEADTVDGLAKQINDWYPEKE